MNPIARTCRPKEVIPIFPFSKLINFFIPLSIVIMMSTAARKQADPCFPAVYELASARVYHGKRIISTEFDTRTGTGSAPATGQRLRSRHGARRNKDISHSGGYPAFFAVRHIYVRNYQILQFQHGEVKTRLAPLWRFSQAAEGKARLYFRMFQGRRNGVCRQDLRRSSLVLSEGPAARRWFPNENVSGSLFFVYRCKN